MSRTYAVDSKELEAMRKRCSIECTFGATYTYDEKTNDIKISSFDAKGTKVELYCITRPNQLMVPFSAFEAVKKDFSYIGKSPFKFCYKLKDYQQYDMEQLLNSVNTDGSCLLQAECGYGKTIMIAYIVAHYKERAIVLTPNAKCAEQNANLIRKAVTGCTVSMTNPDGSFDDKADVLVAVTSQLKGRVGLFDSYPTAIFDEIHALSKPQSIPGMLVVNPRRLIGFTATPEKKEALTRLFVGDNTIIGSKRKRWSIVYLSVPFKHNAARTEFTKISTEVASCDVFIDMLVRLTVYFFGQHKRVMILTERNVLRDSITERVEGLGISVSNIQAKSKCYNADLIIGNKGMVGTGFDLGNAIQDFDGIHPSVVIFAFTLKDATLFKQSSGRSLRSEWPLVIFPEFSGWASSKKHVRGIQEELKGNEYCTHRPHHERLLNRVASGVYDPCKPYG